ncbi:2-keto-myo-inositol dehydratase [Actinoplanes friuliensis DSM 7358]|uniref:2-keto-myo-inositol dehydratase n=1 Tax=Actinoplanes friuliensis DSM 7358 TaxID=1246995 RepID=U5VQ68_9ACTN|nr:2-keto-myo-inositol dehydratase [Actinoplanes friuliensis DSM 7358]
MPGWGYQLPADRVLREMREVGLTATEFGPDGFLPTDEILRDLGLSAIGGFVPVILHDPGHEPAVDFERFVAAGADTVVLAAATGQDGYDSRPVLDARGWQSLLTNLDKLAAAARERGLRAVLHPHVGTMVEQTAEVERVLDGCGIGLCLDTGHLLIGGTDPVVLAQRAGDRIAHVHAKDVDDSVAAEVRAGRLGYTEAVGAGMYKPIGDGDVDFAAVAAALQRHDYDGWWVLEQDTILTGEPAGEGPIADVRLSAGRLREILAAQAKR